MTPTSPRRPARPPARPPLACAECAVPWTVTEHRTGFAAVQPVSWFVVRAVHWTASCGCRVLHADVEGDLYRAMGIPYA